MFFAVIGDIESNFLGLKAVLDTLEQDGIRRILHTGNTVARVEQSMACLALLRDRGVLCVQGSRDRAVARVGRNKKARERDAWASEIYAALDSAAVEYLTGLPRLRTFTEEGLDIVLCHGAINSASRPLTADTPRIVFQRQREIAAADIVACGGAEAPFAYHIDDTFFVCPGRMARTANAACCLLVDTESVPWSADVVSCPI